MASPRALLIAATKELLLPELEANGFQSIDSELEIYRPLDELARAFPFGRMRRTNPDDNFDQVEIQFDKRGRCAFRICAGIIPNKGIDHPHGFIPASDAWVHYLPQWISLYDSRYFACWFKPKHDRHDARVEVAQRAAELLPEIDLWLKSAKRGHHLRLSNSY